MRKQRTAALESAAAELKLAHDEVKRLRTELDQASDRLHRAQEEAAKLIGHGIPLGGTTIGVCSPGHCIDPEGHGVKSRRRTSEPLGEREPEADRVERMRQRAIRQVTKGPGGCSEV